jgi:predicted GNAT family acetyltransferase
MIPMSIDQSLKIDHDPSAQHFTTEVEGHCALLEYRLAGSAMTITHTEVPSTIGGRGIAAELMRTALETANAAGWTVTPACSYAAAYMRKRETGAAHQHEHEDELLDEALEESFPASDPPAIGQVS